MSWFKRKQTCVHCNTVQTKREFENQPTCPDCQLKILTEREPERLCPVDGSTLKKTNNDGIVIDRCPNCNGIWLDEGELEAIRKAATEEGMGSGVAIGMIIG